MNLNYVRKTKNKTNNELSKLYEKRQPPSIVRIQTEINTPL